MRRRDLIGAMAACGLLAACGSEPGSSGAAPGLAEAVRVSEPIAAASTGARCVCRNASVWIVIGET